MLSAPSNYQVALRIKTLCHERVASALSEAESRAQSRLPDNPTFFDGERDYGSSDDSDKWYGGFESSMDDFDMYWNHHKGADFYNSEHSREGTEEKMEEYAEWQNGNFLEEDARISEDTEREYHPVPLRVNVSSFFSGPHLIRQC